MRRRDPHARQGRADLRRRLRPRAAARRLRRHSACSTPPVPARSSPRRRPTRWSPPPRRSTPAPACLFIVKNYEGDVMNFEMAAEMAGREIADGRHRRRRRGRELDLFTTGRRGVAGTLIVEKIVGAAAEAEARSRRAAGARPAGQRPNPLDGRGADLLHRAGGRQADLRASARTRWRWASASMASRVAGACASRIGGRHRRGVMAPILGDLAPRPGAAVLLLVNGFGGTPAMELYLMYNSAKRLLDDAGRESSPLARRLLRHLARHGRLLAHGDGARRRADAPLG